MKRDQPRVALACGYFDWFSGYQEVGLARSLSKVADTTIFASDRVNPIFSEGHLEKIGVPRRYRPGWGTEQGVRILRQRSVQWRSMVLGWPLPMLRGQSFDLLIQVMPGQLFPAIASLGGGRTPRAALYGDNDAMYANLSPSAVRRKKFVFSCTKGRLYGFVNKRADLVYAYTNNTIGRIAPFASGKEIGLLPLTYDSTVFYPDAALRHQWRSAHGVSPDEVVVVAVGKVGRAKRLDTLVSAVATMREQGARVRLAIIGLDDSEESTHLRQEVANRGLEGAILKPFSQAADLNCAFNGSDIGVWPRLPAITVQQAMGTGLRVMIPDNDLVGHLVRSPSAGWLLPPEGPLEQTLLKGLTVATESGIHGLARSDESLAASRWLSADSVVDRILNEAQVCWRGVSNEVS